MRPGTPRTAAERGRGNRGTSVPLTDEELFAKIDNELGAQ